MAVEWDLSLLIIAQTDQCRVSNLISSEKASENRIFYKKDLKKLVSHVLCNAQKGKHPKKYYGDVLYYSTGAI